MTNKPTPEAAAIADALRSILQPGQVVELRALNYTKPGTQYECTASGYFDDLVTMAKEAARLSRNASGVYFTPNPVNPDLLARCCNKVKTAKSGDTTADSHITRRSLAAYRL